MRIQLLGVETVSLDQEILDSFCRPNTISGKWMGKKPNSCEPLYVMEFADNSKRKQLNRS
jgi:hypothetical protein